MAQGAAVFRDPANDLFLIFGRWCYGARTAWFPRPGRSYA